MHSCNCQISQVVDTQNLDAAAKLFKLLGEPNRLRILRILDTDSEHCVCEFEEHMPDVSQSLLSHHLADLREAGLVVSEKRGQKVYYRLTSNGKQATSLIAYA